MNNCNKFSRRKTKGVIVVSTHYCIHTMPKLLIVLLTIILVTSCGQPNYINTSKTLDLTLFTIETPKTWTLINDGINYDSGKIAIDVNDTLNYKYYVDSSSKYRMRSFIPKEDMYNASLNASYEDAINGKKVIVIIPKKTGNGITGIIIDSLYSANSNNNKFELVGTNLKASNEKAFKQAIKTIKFH